VKKSKKHAATENITVRPGIVFLIKLKTGGAAGTNPRFRLSPSMKRVTAGNRRADFSGAGAFQAEIKSKPKGIK
jgi:hypothetical protein